MTEQARARLKKLIDLLEPNVWLELDEISFPRYFGGPLRRTSPQFDTAMDFAKQNGAVLVFLSNPRVAKFGRSSTTRDDNAGIGEAHPRSDR